MCDSRQHEHCLRYYLGLCAGLLCGVHAFAYACEPTPITEVAQGIFVRPGQHQLVFEGTAIANIGFVVGERCVAVIDTGGSPEEGEALRCAIQQHTPLPICQVINTHVHPDHILGNRAFVADEAEFVGHAHLARAMSLVGPHYLERLQAVAMPAGRDWLVPPTLEVTDSLQLDLGNRTLHLQAHGKAHSDSDLTVFDPTTGSLWLGDLLFVEHIPVVEGSLLGFIETLETLQDQPAERVIPGHGPVSLPWPEALDDQQRYLQILRDQTRALIADGETLETALEEVGYSEVERWRLFEALHPRNVSRAYSELEWE